MHLETVRNHQNYCLRKCNGITLVDKSARNKKTDWKFSTQRIKAIGIYQKCTELIAGNSVLVMQQCSNSVGNAISRCAPAMPLTHSSI